jgi:hypothetical protein
MSESGGSWLAGQYIVFARPAVELPIDAAD